MRAGEPGGVFNEVVGRGDVWGVVVAVVMGAGGARPGVWGRGGIPYASSWGGGGCVEVVRVVITLVVVLAGKLGVELVSGCVLRVGVDHFVDHLTSISLLRVQREHRFIKGIDGPALVDVEEGGEVVEDSCYCGLCCGWGRSCLLARGGGPGGGQTCRRVDGEGEWQKKICPGRGVAECRWLGSEPGGV